MVLEPVYCPHCQTTDVVKNGKSAEGKQRYLSVIAAGIGIVLAPRSSSTIPIAVMSLR